MAEDKTEISIPPQIQFSASTPPERQRKILEATQKVDINEVIDRAERKDFRLKEKTVDDERSIENLLTTTQSKLQSLGIDTQQGLLPTNDHVFLTEQVESSTAKGDVVGGNADIVGRFIRLDLLEGMDMSNSQAQHAFYHELSHLITKVVCHYNDIIAYGFDRIPEESITNRGIWGEGLADIFAAYCSETEVKTPYVAEVSFSIALIEDFSAKLGITPLEGFAQMFKAQVTRDFSFQRRLRNLYGTQFVREFNNVETFMSQALRDEIESLAELGGFYENYRTNLQRLETERAITFEGLKGIITKSNSPVE